MNAESFVELAREEWDQGERRLGRLRADPSQALIIDDVVDLLARELRRRVGQTYTLAQLLVVHDSAGRWAQDVAQRSHPGVIEVQDSALIGAVFAAAARGAQDWAPR
jgi:hypothetical protein